MSEKSLMRFGLCVGIFAITFWILFSIYFVEIQRWYCTHIQNCGCGQGYRAIYHGANQKITCQPEDGKR